MVYVTPELVLLSKVLIQLFCMGPADFVQV